MFKLMIADDNPYILQELTESVDWEVFDFDLIGTYPDGLRLWESAKDAVPDLVITDISMPTMDGIQLSSHLHTLNPHIKIIFISEHSEFEYAKKALNLHVFDYILKPIQLDQLTDVMTRVLHQLQLEQRQHFEQQISLHRQDYFRRSALQHYASRLLFQTDSETKIRSEFENFGAPLPDRFSLCLVGYTLTPGITQTAIDSDDFSLSQNYFQSLLENAPEGFRWIPLTCEEHHGIFLLIIQEAILSDSNQDMSLTDQLARLCVDVETMTPQCLTLGYSDCVSRFSELPGLYPQAQTILKHLQSSTPEAPILSYRDIAAGAPTPNQEQPTADPISFSKNVQAMRTFIEQNYMHPITVHDVAHSVYLSSSHASLCFCNECGITIFTYVTQCRMEKAKEFLLDPDNKITHIAELVGYGSKTSFYLAFKRYSGISPTDYRLQYSK